MNQNRNTVYSSFVTEFDSSHVKKYSQLTKLQSVVIKNEHHHPLFHVYKTNDKTNKIEKEYGPIN